LSADKPPTLPCECGCEDFRWEDSLSHEASELIRHAEAQARQLRTSKHARASLPNGSPDNAAPHLPGMQALGKKPAVGYS
jgi:hypothetical protein